MAQKTEKEETEFKVPEALILCVNNCGFTGNPATNNMCQKCFSATTSATTITTTSTAATTMDAATSSTAATTTTSSFMTGSRILKFTGERSARSTPSRSPVKDLAARDASQRTVADGVSRREVNRCTGCRRKVGLTGFRCRCGELFCSEHRYSDRHDCSYDYKSAGREAIARENPVVKAAKIVRV